MRHKIEEVGRGEHHVVEIRQAASGKVRLIARCLRRLLLLLAMLLMLLLLLLLILLLLILLLLVLLLLQ